MIDQGLLLLYKLILSILPFAGTVFLGYLAYKLWMHYIRHDFISGIDYVMLEIIPPRDVERSPKAMELFISNGLYHFSNKGGREAYWQGAVWLWFSLEIVSIEGQVHFYVRAPSRTKELIETQMYAQYPQAQVKVVEDYTKAVENFSEKSGWQGWGCEFGLLKPEAYPIKTYVDFGLDKDPKEEYKVDPISPLIEFFGSLKKGEQAWLQIVVTPSKKSWHTEGTWFGHHDWIEESRVQVFDLLAPYSSFKEVETLQDVGLKRSRIEVRIPPHLEETVKKMRAKNSKLGFDTGIRMMYVAKREAFDRNTFRAMRVILRQYTAPDSNGFNRINSTGADAFDSGLWPLSPARVEILANRLLHEYQEREFFHPPLRHNLYSDHTIPWPLSIITKRIHLPFFHHQIVVLNTEELATLWHFPGQILKVPTLERIESKEASPPTNLPT